MFKEMGMNKEKTNFVHFEEMGDPSDYWSRIESYVNEKKDSASAEIYPHLLDLNEFLVKYCIKELCAGNIKAITFMCSVLDFLKEYDMEYSSDYVLPHKKDIMTGELKLASGDILRDMDIFKKKMHEKNLRQYDFYKWNDDYNGFYEGGVLRFRAHAGSNIKKVKINPREPHIVRKTISEERELTDSCYLSDVDLSYKIRFALAAILYEGSDKKYNGEILSDLRELARLITEAKYLWNGEVIEIDKINNRFMPEELNKQRNATALKRLMRCISDEMTVYCAYAHYIYTGRDIEWFLHTCILNERFVRDAEHGFDNLKGRTPEALKSVFAGEVSVFFSYVKLQSEMLLKEVKDLYGGSEGVFFINGKIPGIKLEHLPVTNSCSMSIREDPFIIKSDNPIFSWLYLFLYPFSRKKYDKFSGNDSYNELINREGFMEEDSTYEYVGDVEADERLVNGLPKDFDFRPFISLMDIKDANMRIKASFGQILSYKEKLTSCVKSLVMIETIEKELTNGNPGFYFDMAKEILDYCYTDSDYILTELQFFAMRPKIACTP